MADAAVADPDVSASFGGDGRWEDPRSEPRDHQRAGATPGGTDVTPAAWRILAAGVLGGSLLAGARAGRSVTGSRLLWLGGLVVAGYVLPLLRASRRPPLPPLDRLPSPAVLPTVTVLVAARDEAVVLPQLVADVAAQDHRDASGRPRFELIVVDDRSTDGSGPAVLGGARSSGIADVTRVIRRGPPESAGADAIAAAGLPDGKGAALTAAPPEQCAGKIIVVLDADARIAPDFLRRVAGYVTRGSPAVTARRRVHPAPARAGWLATQLAAIEDDEQTADGALQRGRWALGGCSEFRGNGIVVRRDDLAAVGGWRADALCEDLDLSTRLATHSGTRVGWAIDAVVEEEPVVELGPLWRQRCRWAEGIVRRQLAHTLPLLRSRALPVGAKADYLAYSAQTVVPLAMLGALADGLRRRDLRGISGLAAIYLAAGTAVAADALRWSPGSDGQPPGLLERIGRGLRAAMFSAHWLVVFPVGWGRIALARGPIRYQKMAHAGRGRSAP